MLRNTIRTFNKHIFNRLTIRFAGARHSPFATIRHVGRRSGKQYETPLIVQPIRGGFVFALTYGPDVDWYRNVVAAGHATLRWNGRVYALEKPEPIAPRTALPAFPLPQRLVLRLLKIRHFMRMSRGQAPG